MSVNLGEVNITNMKVTGYMISMLATGSQIQLSNSLVKANTITPAQLTGTNDNFNPTGLSTANIVELTGDSSFRHISGMTAQLNGTIIDLVNTGSNTILLCDESTVQGTNSTATNRFAFDGYDVPLFPKSVIPVMYNTTLGRWIIIHKQAPIVPPRLYGYHAQTDIGSINGDNIFSITSASGGSTSTGIDGGANHPGILQYTLGTSASGGGSCRIGTSSFIVGNSWYYRFDCICKVLSLSTVTDRYTLRVGFFDSTSAESTDGVFFRYTDNVNSGKWERVTINNTTATATDTTVTVGTTNYTRLTIIINPAGSNCEFFIDGTSRGSNTTNIPIGAARNTGAGFMFLKSAGTTDTAFFNLDALEVFGYAPTKRTL